MSSFNIHGELVAESEYSVQLLPAEPEQDGNHCTICGKELIRTGIEQKAGCPVHSTRGVPR